MKALAGVMGVLILFAVSFLITYVTGLYNLGGVLETPSWKVFSCISPYLGTLVDGQLLALMVVIAGMGIIVLRGLLKRSYLTVSIFCLASGFIPLQVGWILMFRNLSGDNTAIGRYLSMTLLGPLYALIFSMFFAGLYLWKENPQTGRNLPRKSFAWAIAILNLFLMSILLTHITFYCNLGGEGDVSFWKLYPSLPPLRALWYVDGFILMAVITGIEMVFLCRILKRSYLVLSLFCLASGFIPFQVGRILMFRNSGGDSAAIGHWLAMTLHGPLYAIIFSLIFAELYLWKGSVRVGKNPLSEEKDLCLSTAK